MATNNRAQRRATAKKATTKAPAKKAPARRSPVPNEMQELRDEIAHLHERIDYLAWIHAELALQFRTIMVAALLQQAQGQMQQQLSSQLTGLTGGQDPSAVFAGLLKPHGS